MKTNKHLNRLVATTVSTGLFSGSFMACNYEAIEQQDIDLGKIAIPVGLNIGQNQTELLSLFRNLSIDIVNNPVIARRFSKNPQDFLKRYGYNGSVNLDDGTMKLVLALGDKEINAAVKTNNIKLFLSLCKEKGLLSNTIESTTFSKDEIKTMLDEMGLNATNQEISTLQEGLLIPVILIVVAVAVVVVYVVTDDEFEVTGEAYSNKFDVVTNDNPVLTYWTLKDKKEQAPLVINTFMEEQVEAMVSIIEETCPTFFEHNDKEVFRNEIRINFLKYYKLR